VRIGFDTCALTYLLDNEVVFTKYLNYLKNECAIIFVVAKEVFVEMMCNPLEDVTNSRFQKLFTISQALGGRFRIAKPMGYQLNKELHERQCRLFTYDKKQEQIKSWHDFKRFSLGFSRLLDVKKELHRLDKSLLTDAPDGLDIKDVGENVMTYALPTKSVWILELKNVSKEKIAKMLRRRNSYLVSNNFLAHVGLITYGAMQIPEYDNYQKEFKARRGNWTDAHIASSLSRVELFLTNDLGLIGRLDILKNNGICKFKYENGEKYFERLLA